MDDIEVRELRYFIAVAEELSFTRAAARLCMAQPPLSAAIGKLERKLGVTLLERTTRRVTLTQAGAVLRVAVLPIGHRLAKRRELRRADLAGEPMPHWAGPADPAIIAHWTATDTSPRDPTTAPDTAPPSGDRCADGREESRPGTAINDLNQLLDAVALGKAVAYVPASIANRCCRPELVFLPVSDVSASRVVVAWPDTSHSDAVARFVRTAVEVAAERSLSVE